MDSHLDPFIDDDGRQIKPFPSKWISPSPKAKPGAQVRYLGPNPRLVFVGPYRTPASDPELNKPENWKDLRTQIGTVLKVTPGRRGSGRFVPSHECYDTDSSGWLTVQFPFSPYRNADGTFGPMALHFYEEGSAWEFAPPTPERKL